MQINRISYDKIVSEKSPGIAINAVGTICSDIEVKDSRKSSRWGYFTMVGDTWGTKLKIKIFGRKIDDVATFYRTGDLIEVRGTLTVERYPAPDGEERFIKETVVRPEYINRILKASENGMYTEGDETEVDVKIPNDGGTNEHKIIY